ncbi:MULTISPECIES: hypothetical protein [unclassified Methylobacterium]|jgi:hypothetical protein|uniref:hypothetical protein n=1 Tax=unclassified Methylobacterium TaxID=2615210 RepID=UPI0013530A9F|nr:hypothetical protein [Methylobacterium sp. 2A]MWV22423.1 hypothetical protein [Methylobacterium sp. 2A]
MVDLQAIVRLAIDANKRKGEATSKVLAIKWIRTTFDISLGDARAMFEDAFMCNAARYSEKYANVVGLCQAREVPNIMNLDLRLAVVEQAAGKRAAFTVKMADGREAMFSGRRGDVVALKEALASPVSSPAWQA